MDLPARAHRRQAPAAAAALYLADRLPVRALGPGAGGRGLGGPSTRLRRLDRQAGGRRRLAGGVRDRPGQDAGVSRPRLPGGRLHDGDSGGAAAVRLAWGAHVSGLAFDIAHLLAGVLVLASLLMLFQDRLTALINVFSARALPLARS